MDAPHNEPSLETATNDLVQAAARFVYAAHKMYSAKHSDAAEAYATLWKAGQCVPEVTVAIGATHEIKVAMKTLDGEAHLLLSVDAKLVKVH